MVEESKLAESPSKFLAAQRRTMIASFVLKNDWVTIRELREITRASSATIRRDIHYLATRHLLRPVHGGAISLRAHTMIGELAPMAKSRD